MTYVVVVLAMLLVFYFLFRKPKKAAVTIFPASWLPYVEVLVFYKRLDSEEQEHFKQRILQFLNQVYIEGVKTEVTDKDKVWVAAAAVIPTLAFDDWYYPNLSTVLLYPDTFNTDLEFEADSDGKVVMGLVGNGRFKHTMILSKTALHHGFENDTDKLNTAIHEFAHLIDGVDGAIDGVPNFILESPNAIPWLRLMHDTMEAIHANASDIRQYGGTSQSEFFAVVSEYFFSRPALMQRKHPELYGMLSACFRQHPAG